MSSRWSNLKEILHLLLPMVITLTLEFSISLIDTLMLGHYDSYHLAAVGIASSLWVPVGCLVMGTMFGLTPLITRHLHGRQPKLVNLYMSQAVGVCLSIGVLLTIFVVTVLPYFVGLMNVEEQTKRLAIYYLYFFAPAIPVLAFTIGYKNLFEAASRPHFPLLVAIMGLLLNVLLNYLLIYGAWGFPELGVVGAAIASTIATYCGVLVFFCYDRLFNPVTLFSQIKLKYLFKFGVLLHVGMPAGFALAFEVMLFSSIMWLASSFGDLAVGASQIAMSYTSILFTPLMAISSVSAILVAKALSAQGGQAVREKIRVIVALGFGYNLICLTLTQWFAIEIPLLYTSDTDVALMASGVLVIASVYQIVDMLQTTFTGALRGLRDTRTSMLAFAVSLFGLSLPLGFWLAHYSPWAERLTIKGFHIGLGIGLTLLAVILISRFYYLLRRRTSVITSTSLVS
ncbi:MATE family efflux transporter [Marinomonas agarivorans]|nr:MATE family efflux transporter [Marinomonas agarivorans]